MKRIAFQSCMHTHRPRESAFTLVELLVVIGIIVVLLALLVPAVTKALKYADKAKCAANQRNIAQGLVGYSLASQQKNFPPSVASWTSSRALDGDDDTYVVAGDFAYSMDYRAVTQAGIVESYPANDSLALLRWGWGFGSPITGAVVTPPLLTATTPDPGAGGNVPQKPLGLGILVAAQLLPAAKLGEVAHCPSLNTSSALPTPDFGTDNAYPFGDNHAPTISNGSRGAGGSFYLDPGQAESRIVGSYTYRGLSFAMKRGGTASIKTYDTTSGFVILMDNPDVRFGRKFCHKDGYNVAYGDASVRYYEDAPTTINGDPAGQSYSSLERQIWGYRTAPGTNNQNPRSVDGRSGYHVESRTHMEEEESRYWPPMGGDGQQKLGLYPYLATQRK